MKRPTLNLLIDLLAGFAFLGLIVTGYILRFPLPPRSGRTHLLWGLDRHDWGAVHSWISLFFLVVLLVHVSLHWQWIVATLGKRLWPKSRNIHSNHCLTYGFTTLAVLAVILGAFAWFAHVSVQDSGDSEPQQRKRLRGETASIETTQVPTVMPPKQRPPLR